MKATDGPAGHLARIEKPQGYFRGDRPDLAELVPWGARRLLDVGCGEGRFGQLAKVTRGLEEVVGVELDPDVAAIARCNLDRVHVGSIETVRLDYDEGYFDCIVCADVIEHTPNPVGVLRKLLPCLCSNGLIIVSVPNMSHLYVILKLLFDRFAYTNSGILDRTHLQFFTPYKLRVDLMAAGFTLESMELRQSGDWPARIFRVVSLGLLPRLTAYQVVATARIADVTSVWHQ